MATGTPSGDRQRAHTGAIVAAVGTIIVCWLLLVPPGGQPDEHSHLVRSAALVRGTEPLASDADVYELPERYDIAEPACYAFQPTISADCALPPVRWGEPLPLYTRANDYPPGAHAVYGVVGLLPGLDPIWWGRIAAALVSTALVGLGLSLTARRDQAAGAALLVGLTPMAWSIMSAVNPSAVVTAGAVALWAGLSNLPPPVAARVGVVGARWLTAAGWAAMTLSRRDGLVWSCIVTAVVLAYERLDLADAVRRLGRVPLAVVAVATAITCWWGVTSDSSTSRLVVAAPIALAAFEGARVVMRRVPARTAWQRSPVVVRIVVATAAALATAGAWMAVVATRSGGWDTDLTVTVIGQTDDNLIEAIGVMGWLDTSVPRFVVFAWLATIGALMLLAAHRNRRALAFATVTVTLAMLTAWTFELLQGNSSGTYWQGRYSLPLLIGVPFLLARSPDDRPPGDPELAALAARWSVVVGVAAMNVGAWAAARRWGVGTLGSHLPWRWDTTVQPVHPLLILVVLAAASVVLARATMPAAESEL